MATTRVKTDNDRSYVRALARGLEILKALGTWTADGATLSDVAALVKLDRATARRFLLTLSEIGYVTTDGKRFALAPKVLELGFSYFSAMTVWERVQPILDDLSEKQKGAVSIGVIDGKEVVYVARAQNRRSVYTLNVSVGSRFPIYSSSIGRILLSGMDDQDIKAFLKQVDLVKRTPKTISKLGDIMNEVARVRKLGYCISDEETEVGIRSIAVPVFGRDGKIIAGFNASVQSSVADKRALVSEFLPLLKAGAVQVQAAMQLRTS